jgi:hypothetical protein
VKDSGESIALDNSLSSKGPDRFVLDYPEESGAPPIAIPISDARPEFAHPRHDTICGKPGQQ